MAEPLTMADILAGLNPGPGGVGGNFGTMTPQEVQQAAYGVTPGTVLNAVAQRAATLPQRAFEASENLRQGGSYDPGPVLEAASMMLGGGGAGARAAAETGPSHVLGITRDRALNAEDWLHEKLLDTPLPGSDLAERLGTFVLGSGSRRLAPAAIAAPNIREARTPLFDYSRLSEVPDVPQAGLQRYVPPRGVPADFAAISPETIARANAAVSQGLGQGGMEWYNTLPLRDYYSEILGTTEGPARYRDYLNAVGATSPDARVPQNIRAASYYDYLLRNQLPLPERLIKPETGNWYVPPGQIPNPYGARAQALHVQNMQALRDTGQLPLLENPKPSSFIENLMGNYQPVTIDRHNLRMFGLGRSEPGPGYGYLEGLQQAQAGKMGIAPAQYQAGGWIGAGEDTGVLSSNDPFLKVLEDRVRLTAEQKGMTPAAVLKEFVQGKMPLR